MDFSWTEEQVRFRDSVIGFSKEHLDHDMVESDAEHIHSTETRGTSAPSSAFKGLPVPEEYGGQGADPLTIILAMEALGYGCRDNGLICSRSTPRCGRVRSRSFVSAPKSRNSATSPACATGASSACKVCPSRTRVRTPSAMATTAVTDGDDYVLNGSKTWITNAPIADVFVVFAVTDRSKGAFGLSAFLVDA